MTSIIPHLRNALSTMAGLDGRHWRAAFAFQAYGVSIGIRTDTPELLDRLHAARPFGWLPYEHVEVDHLYSVIIHGEPPDEHAAGHWVVYADADRAARGLDLNTLVERLESNIRLYVAEHAVGSVFVHAGVVGWEGKAIVIPGRSFSGKTTLVAALVRAGATYYSDEYAVFDRAGLVHPFPKPLSMREGDGPEQLHHPVESLGGVAGSVPLPVGLIVATEYRVGARWQPEYLSAAEGALALLAHAVAARRAPESVLAVLREAVAGRPVIIKGMRGEAEEVVREMRAIAALLSPVGGRVKTEC